MGQRDNRPTGRDRASPRARCDASVRSHLKVPTLTKNLALVQMVVPLIIYYGSRPPSLLVSCVHVRRRRPSIFVALSVRPVRAAGGAGGGDSRWFVPARTTERRLEPCTSAIDCIDGGRARSPAGASVGTQRGAVGACVHRFTPAGIDSSRR